MTQTWTQQRFIKFFIAHVLFVVNPVTVLQYNAQLFSKRPSLRILWLRCLRRLNVTVGYANFRTCVTLWSVCSRTCQVTTCIRFFGQLNFDLRELDVLLWCVRDAITIMFTNSTLWPVLLSNGSRPLLRPKCAFVNLRLIVYTRSQLRS